jgi:hypothetical protein
MPGRMRHIAARSALLATLIAGGLSTSASATDVPSDLIDWYVDTSFDAYSSTYHVSSGGPNPVSFRWLDSPHTQTQVYAANCLTNVQYGSMRTYAVGSTSYQTLFTGATDTCFKLWGRTTSGSMSDHDGRVLR